MTPDRWRQIREQFQRLRVISGDEQGRELIALRQQDADLAAEVESLLRADVAATFDPATELSVDSPSSADTDSDWEGREFGSYRLLRLLGRGGMGTVYLAERVRDFSRQVAIKFLNKSISGPIRRRFIAERQVLAQFDHPRIVRLLDGGETADGTQFLVMEYIEGPDLATYCAMHALSIEQRMVLLQQITDAVEFAHQMGFIHRDLKPSNILMTPEGVPKITDFGLARSMSQSGQTTSTDPGTILGTPAYLPPEVLNGQSRHPTPLIDCYSVGAIGYQLLAGRPPYEGDSPMQVCLAVIERAPIPLIQSSRNLPRDVVTVIEKAMARETSERFASAGALSNELGRFLDGKPLSIKGPSRLDPVWKWGRRNRKAMAVVASAAMLLLLTTIVTLVIDNGRVRQAWQETKRQETIANVHLKSMKDLIRNASLSAEHLTQAVMMGTDASRAYFENMHEFYTSVLARVPGADQEPDLVFQTALAHYHLALDLEERDSNGTAADRLALYNSALALVRPLVAQYPKNPWYRNEVFRLLKARCNAYQTLGNPLQAQLDAFEALDAAHSLVRAEPDQPDWRDVEANAHWLLGSILLADDQPWAAEQQAIECLSIAQGLWATHPDRPTYLANLRLGKLLLAEVKQAAGDLASAESHLRSVLLVDGQLRQFLPGTPWLQRAIDEDRSKLVSLLLALNRDSEAAAVARETKDDLGRLARSGFLPLRLQDWPIEARIQLAEIELRLGRQESAENNLRAALAEYEDLLERDSTNKWLTRLADLYEQGPIEMLRNPARGAELRLRAAATPGPALPNAPTAPLE